MKKQIGVAILAGGKASRLGGIAKGNLKINSTSTIITHQLSELRKLDLSEIVICANNKIPYENYGVNIIADNYFDYGPIAGIESALEYFDNRVEAVLFLPCDLPNIAACEINTLLQAYSSKNDLVFAVTSNKNHPLCCVINVKYLNSIQGLINRGEKKIAVFWDAFGGCEHFFANERTFFNINSYTDIVQLTD